jgi:hypothetical protein
MLPHRPQQSRSLRYKSLSELLEHGELPAAFRKLIAEGHILLEHWKDTPDIEQRLFQALMAKPRHRSGRHRRSQFVAF